MTICGEIHSDRRWRLSRKMRVILFFAFEGAAALLIGFAALFLSFEPGWSAERAQTAFLKPGDARSGSLLLKTDDGYADAARLGSIERVTAERHGAIRVGSARDAVLQL